MPRVFFVKQGKAVEVPVGANLRQVALENGIDLYEFPFHLLNCRGNGLCGTCKVRVNDNSALSPRVPVEDKKLDPEDPTLRLSCRCTVTQDVEVTTQPKHLGWFEHPYYAATKSVTKD